MADRRGITVGETIRNATLVAKASGSPIVGGTVNYYCLAQSGANAGKWWKNSDQTWAAAETANAMTHKADGHWSITLAASPFADGILYMEYFKESGDLHIPQRLDLIGRYEPTVASDLTTLAADASAAATAAVLARKILQNKATVTFGATTVLTIYADDGTTPYLTANLTNNAGTKFLITDYGPANQGALA